MFKTDKTLFYKDSISSKGLLSFVKSPFEMGLDLSINPIVFKRREESSFQIAFSLNNSTKFRSWLVDGPGSKWAFTSRDMNGFELFEFRDRAYIFAIAEGALLFTNDTVKPEKIAIDFFDNTHSTGNQAFTPAANAVVSVRFNSPYSTYISGFTPITVQGQIDVFVNDTVLFINSPQFIPSKSLNSGFTQYLDDTSIRSHVLSPLADFWHLNDSNLVCLKGIWSLDWHGTAVRKLEYISYDFDDFFNRIEVRKSVDEYYPNIQASFRPFSTEGGWKWHQHLKKHGLMRNDSIKIGTFWYPFIQNRETFYFGRGPDSTLQEKIIATANIHFPTLKADFKQIGIPFPIGDSTMAHSLEKLYMANEMSQLQLELSCKPNNPYHILAFPLHFVNAAFRE